MASKIADAFVEIGARTSKFNKGMAGVRQRLGNIAGGFKRLAKIGVAAFAAIGVAAGLAVKSFTEQEDAENSLRSALKRTGLEVEKNFKRFVKFAAEIQNTTKFGDEMTLSLIAQARNLGVAEDQLESVTKGALGMSKALGIDLNSAIRNTALALQGEFTILQRYIPALRQTTDATEKMAIVQKLMNAGFKQAQDETKTLSTKFTQLRNDFGDAVQKIGGVISELLDLGKGFDALRDKIKEIPGRIDELIEKMGGLEKIKKDVLGFSKDVAKGLLLLSESMLSVAKTANLLPKGFNKIQGGLRLLKVDDTTRRINFLIRVMSRLDESQTVWRKGLQREITMLRKHRDELFKTIDVNVAREQVMNKMQSSLDKLKGKLSDTRKELGKTTPVTWLEKLNAELAKTGVSSKGAVKQISTDMSKAGKSIKGLFDNIKKDRVGIFDDIKEDFEKIFDGIEMGTKKSNRIAEKQSTVWVGLTDIWRKAQEAALGIGKVSPLGKGVKDLPTISEGVGVATKESSKKLTDIENTLISNLKIARSMDKTLKTREFVPTASMG